MRILQYQKVADKIVQSKADYLLALKENQPTLSDELRDFFDQADHVSWEGISHSYHETIEKDHGRIEIRRVHVVEDIEWIPEKFKSSKLSSLGTKSGGIWTRILKRDSMENFWSQHVNYF